MLKELCDAIALECLWAKCRAETQQDDGEQPRSAFYKRAGADIVRRMIDPMFCEAAAELPFPFRSICRNGCCEQLAMRLALPPALAPLIMGLLGKSASLNPFGGGEVIELPKPTIH